jgi:hypothetical protein
MARIGVSITKSVAFRNSTQEFSNVYYYDVTALPSIAQADTFIDNLVALEKTFHSSLVTFVRGRVWSETGSAATNEMISQKNVSGTGARATLTGLDKERAFLFRLRAGVDSRGNPVYLRKWFHACGVFFSGQGIASSILENSSGFSSGDRSSMVTAMNGIGGANGSPLSPALVSKAGRFATAGATWDAHQFLEHHQLGDQWRAQ